MTPLIVNKIVPLILLVITVIMMASDLSFRKKHGAAGVVYDAARAVKTLSLAGIALIFHLLDPQFLQPHPELFTGGRIAPELLQAFNAYNLKWDFIFLLSAVFTAAFLVDVWGRIRAVQASYQRRAESFLQDEIERARQHQDKES